MLMRTPTSRSNVTPLAAPDAIPQEPGTHQLRLTPNSDGCDSFLLHVRPRKHDCRSPSRESVFQSKTKFRAALDFRHRPPGKGRTISNTQPEI